MRANVRTLEYLPVILFFFMRWRRSAAAFGCKLLLNGTRVARLLEDWTLYRTFFSSLCTRAHWRPKIVRYNPVSNAIQPFTSRCRVSVTASGNVSFSFSLSFAVYVNLCRAFLATDLERKDGILR